MIQQHDPLEMLKCSDDVSVYNKVDGSFEVELSNGVFSNFKRMVPNYDGIKYLVTEGDLQAEIEVTNKGDIFLNNKKVTFTEKVSYEQLVSQNSISNTPRSGWSQWTWTPLIGNASDYTKLINTKVSNVNLETGIMYIPIAAFIVVLAAAIPFGPGIAVGLATAAKALHVSAGINPLKLHFKEYQRQIPNNYKANKYTLYWLDTYGNYLNYASPQLRYLTIG